MQVTVCAELENRIRLSLCTLHCGQFNFQDALSCKSRQSCWFYKIGQFLPKPNNGLPNFTFLRQRQNPLNPSLHKSLKYLYLLSEHHLNFTKSLSKTLGFYNSVLRNPSGWESRKKRSANQLYVLGIQGLDYNAHMYEIVGGLRATLLSAVNKFATGSGVPIHTKTPNILYMMLCTGFIFSLNNTFYFSYIFLPKKRIFFFYYRL